MKNILKYAFVTAILACIVYLLFSYSNNSINYEYEWSMDIIFLVVVVLLLLITLVVIVWSYSRKKWIAIVLHVCAILCAYFWFRDNAIFFGGDITKLLSVLWVFFALFGVYGSAKELPKWTYSKKVEIIEV